jgi:hypothetical protein
MVSDFSKGLSLECQNLDNTSTYMISMLYENWGITIPPLAIVTNMFRNWLNGVAKISKVQIQTGICALIWAIWNCENDIILNKNANDNFIQFIYMVTH